MAVFRRELTMTEDQILPRRTHVLESEGEIRGFYTLVPHSDTTVELEHLFIEPAQLRLGYGSALFLHAKDAARRARFRQMLVQSDPHAAGFYRALSARLVKEIPSSIPGRFIPCFELDLTGAPSVFTGFPPEALAFLSDLAGHNTKAWFETHREEYRAHFLLHLQNLVTDLSGFMLGIDPEFETRPAVDRTISRIHRDIRFSRDKSPYRTTAWITFKRPIRNWQDSPAFFFEIAPASCRYGMGFYGASRQTMDRLRAAIDGDDPELRRLLASFSAQEAFVTEGESYKRPLRPDLSAPLGDWYNRKNLYLVRNRPADDRLFGREILDDLREGFDFLAPFYRYFRQIGAQTTK